MSIERKPARLGRAALDPNDICCEIYNPGSEEITFVNIHTDRHIQHFHGKGPKHWAVIRCKPNEWVYLPHQKYSGSVPSGSEEIRVIKNFGDEMFKGNKHPSRPEVQRKLY